MRWSTPLLALACLASQALALTPAPVPTETLLTDTRVPVETNGAWVMMSREELGRRGQGEPNEIVPRAGTTTFEIQVSTVTQVSTTSTAAASPLPSPFDSNLSSNFSQANGVATCPRFINSFLNDPTYKSCYPFSLLLQGSLSFFNAEKSLVSITQVLDATCAADANKCTTYMGNLAKNLTSTANCGTDYGLGNPIAVQAYVALVAYQAVYSAACLKDTETSSYCFANAITNLTNPTDAYFYYLPLNLSLPGSTMPSCGVCVQRTMSIFQNAAANRNQPIALTYPSAAQQVNSICGPAFVNETLPLALVIKDSGGITLTPSWAMLVLTLFGALQWIL